MNLLHDIKVIFYAIIIFQCLFFSIYLLTQANARRRNNVWLAAFLLAVLITAAGGFIGHFQEIRPAAAASAPWLFYMDTPFAFLYIPLLYMYILSLTRDEFRLRWRHFMHAGAFVLVALAVGLKIGMTSRETLLAALREAIPFRLWEQSVLIYLADAQFFGYSVAAFLALKAYRKTIKDLYSSIERINLSWLNYVLVGFIGWRSLRVVEYSLWLAGKTNASIPLYITSQIVFLVFVSLMFFKGMKQPVIFLGEDSPKARRKYEKTLLPEVLRTEYRIRLVRFMEERKPFLSPLISLPELASQVKIPAHHLSQVLNTCFGQNFFDFINTYRIRESQRLLTMSDGRERTVLDILYETGFNSKSVFNAAFKKYTGLTPSQFKRLPSRAVEVGERNGLPPA